MAGGSPLGFHRLLCPKCRLFRAQLAEVETAIGLFLTDDHPDAEGLTDDARQRILDALANDTAG